MTESLLPHLLVAPPGPRSAELTERLRNVSAPMGPRAAYAPGSSSLVLTRGSGSNLFCADENRYVDLVGGFGAMLLGHDHPRLIEAATEQASTLLQALGDVYPSDEKVELLEALSRLHPSGTGQAILGQSGADALTAALKTATLKTGRSRMIAFSASYHGLSFAPLAITDLRASYREPFAEQLSGRTSFVRFPKTQAEAAQTLEELKPLLAEAGAVVFEPIQGRAGVWPPPEGFLRALCHAAHEHGALTIADEVWTGLGRAGEWLVSSAEGAAVDLLCLGKGLGGGFPISACVGSRDVMSAWSREQEVVHTSTFAGAPLACRAARTTLALLESEHWVKRSAELGASFLGELRQATAKHPSIQVRGRGLMVGIDVADFPGEGRGIQKALLERGYVTSTGGGARNVLVLTPALNIPESLLAAFVSTLADVLD